jgi:hypothetical protein
MTAEDVSRAFEVVAATASAMRSHSHSQGVGGGSSSHPPSHSKPPVTAPALHRQSSHVRETSNKTEHEGAGAGGAGAGAGATEGHGGHDAPNWSRAKSASVLMGCTVLYAIIAGEFLACVPRHQTRTDSLNTHPLGRDFGRRRRCRSRRLWHPRKVPRSHLVCSRSEYHGVQYVLLHNMQGFAAHTDRHSRLPPFCLLPLFTSSSSSLTHSQ